MGLVAEHADVPRQVMTFVVVASAVFVGIFVGGVLGLARIVERLTIRH